MKKYIIYFLLFLIICFSIPLMFTNTNGIETAIQCNNKINDNINEKVNTNVKDTTQEYNLLSEITYDYNEYNNIKLLHVKTNEIEELYLDEYLYGVVSAEMPANFEIEALKAQAVVARTYTIYNLRNNKNKHDGSNICDDYTCCQAWISKQDRLEKWEEPLRQSNWNKIVQAVNATQGLIITYNNEPINAFFHSNSGGQTEITEDVWGGSGYPYLQTVSTAGEEGYSQYYSELILTKDTFVSKLKEKHNEFEIDFDDINAINIIEYTQGNRIKIIKIGNMNFSGVEIRTIFSLKSANFEIIMDDKNVKFKVIGYGHGVGMSQTGADSMAKQGSGFEEIIKHFYTGVEIKDV